MRVLVTYGSRYGGTAGIAECVGAALGDAGFHVDVLPAGEPADVTGYDAVVVGSGLRANRWHPDARRFVRRYAAALRERPVWLFSSGPLDDAASLEDIPPTPQVAGLAASVGAVAHVTFGGMLDAGVEGPLAGLVARKHAGDWRDLPRVRAWATDLAAVIDVRMRTSPI